MLNAWPWLDRSWGCVLALVLLCVAGGVAHPRRAQAQDTSAATARALELTREALQRYQDGDLEGAVALLTEARALHPGEPLLLYNLARAYEGLGQLREAADAYTGYLREAPEAPERGAVEVRIASIERVLREREQLAEEERLARLEAERAEAERARAEARAGASSPSPAPWIVLAGGAAVIAVGGVMGGVALLERDAALATDIHEQRVARFRTAEDDALVANVLFAAGGTIALTGLIWGIVELTSAGSAPASESPPLAIRF